MIGIFILGTFAAYLVWTRYYRKHWAKQLTAELAFGREYLYAGEQTVITERIENRKRMPVPILEVAFHIRREICFLDMENTSVSDLTYKRDIFSLLGRQRITRNLAVECRRRGYYQIEKVDFTAYSLFHATMYTLRQPVSTSLYVYAERTDVSELVCCCERLLGTRECAKRLYEDPFAFRGIREYTVTDPMKTVNWKASAKSGKWMVNTFDSTLVERVMLYLNVEDEGILRHDHLIEEGISVAASLAQRLIAGGTEVGIAVNVEGEKYCMLPAGGRERLTSIERMLAELTQKERFVPYKGILKELPEDAIPVFISEYSDGIEQAMIGLLGKENEGIWVMPVSDAAGGRKEDIAADGDREWRGLQSVRASGRLRVLIRKVDGV